jgi:hypothetical protein
LLGLFDFGGLEAVPICQHGNRGLKESLCVCEEKTHLLGPEEGSDDPVLCLVDPLRGYDRQRVPLVPLGVCTLPCSSRRGLELILLILFRADEAVDGSQVGQEQVVPVHELEERRQCVRRRRVVLVRGELRLEVRDGVDELDEAEAERVQVLVPVPAHRRCWSLHFFSEAGLLRRRSLSGERQRAASLSLGDQFAPVIRMALQSLAG